MNEKIPVIRVRCSRTTINGIATGANWISIFRSKGMGSEIPISEEDDVSAPMLVLRKAHRHTDDMSEELDMVQVVDRDDLS